ncbi:MAG: PilZ domain-containing protein [Gemmataceae bacterium]|nr:PilZ domain-containing protein [Gemmataceae bacterium]MCI0741042.1 PilZ domain-containing protein [Gemmataceae bacterium]
MASSLQPVYEILNKHSWKNQRASVRYCCAPATAGKVILDDNTPFLRAWIVNLSEGGLALVVEQPLEVGQLLNIQMKSAASDNLVQLAAQVAHCTQQSRVEWFIGCEFLTPLSKEQLDELL